MLWADHEETPMTRQIRRHLLGGFVALGLAAGLTVGGGQCAGRRGQHLGIRSLDGRHGCPR